MRSILTVAWLALVLGVNNGYAKDLVVDAKSAGEGEFKTVKAALDAVPANNKEPVTITIKPGKYEEFLSTPKDKGFITFKGMGAKPEDTVLTYHYKASDAKPDGTGTVGTTGSASITINGNDFTAQNMTFANSAGDKVGQAVAMKTNGDRLVFLNCRFLGFQDTLYPAGGGRCYFKDCFITGNHCCPVLTKTTTTGYDHEGH
jgi:pectinesterase